MFENRNVNCLDRAAVVAAACGTATSTPLATSGVDTRTRNFGKLQLWCLLGNMAAETILIQIGKASDAGGTGFTAISSILYPAHATNNDNKQVSLEVDQSAFKNETSKFFVVARVTTGSSTGGPVGLLILGHDPRQEAIKSLNTVHANIVDEYDRDDDNASVVLLKRKETVVDASS